MISTLQWVNCGPYSALSRTCNVRFAVSSPMFHLCDKFSGVKLECRSLVMVADVPTLVPSEGVFCLPYHFLVRFLV